MREIELKFEAHFCSKLLLEITILYSWLTGRMIGLLAEGTEKFQMEHFLTTVLEVQESLK